MPSLKKFFFFIMQSEPTKKPNHLTAVLEQEQVAQYRAWFESDLGTVMDQ